MRNIFFIAVLASVVVISASAQIPAASSASSAVNGVTSPAYSPPSYTPHRVYDTRRKRFADFETMLASLSRADLVFLGEQHNDPGTHRLQAAVLEGLDRRREGAIVLALEMFERDAQSPLDTYLAGTTPESTFLAASRPWPNYASDYRPLVEYARANRWPVIAGNVPRRFAQVISRRGLGAIDTLPAGDRALIAQDISCPRDDYFRRFSATMGDMSGHGMTLSPEQLEATVWRIYEAQCVKDETMAEAIAAAAGAHNTLVVHANGSFHSDYRLGTASRAKRRMPGSRMVVVSFVPVADLDTADGKSRRALGDWVVFTLAPPAPSTVP